MIDGQPLACFQPFIDTATGRIAGVEALGRLRQADGRLQSVGPLFADPRTPTVHTAKTQALSVSTKVVQSQRSILDEKRIWNSGCTDDK